MPAKIYLASASPRRKQLLAQLDVVFEQFSTDIDESLLPGEEAEQFVCRLAEEKAIAGVQVAAQDYPVLGSDTVVVLDSIRDVSLLSQAAISVRVLHETTPQVAIATVGQTLRSVLVLHMFVMVMHMKVVVVGRRVQCR